MMVGKIRLCLLLTLVCAIMSPVLFAKKGPKKKYPESPTIHGVGETHLVRPTWTWESGSEQGNSLYEFKLKWKKPKSEKKRAYYHRRKHKHHYPRYKKPKVDKKLKTKSLSYTPEKDLPEGIYEITLKEKVGKKWSKKVKFVTIIDKDANNAPVLSLLDTTTEEDAAIELSVNASDVDLDNLAFTVSTPSIGVISGSAPNWLYTPNVNEHGTEILTVSVNDGFQTVENTLSIIITPINDAPVLSVSDAATDEDQAVDLAVSATDIDEDELEYTISAPVKGVISGEAPNWTYTPNPNEYGTEELEVEVDDGVLTETDTLTITINPVNDAPSLTFSNASTLEDIPVSLSVSANDIDHINLTYTISTPTKGTLSGVAPNWLYTPNVNTFGSEVLAIEVNDGSLAATGSLTVTIAPVNDAPVLNISDAVANEDQTVDLSVSATDVDGDALTYQISTPSNGSLSGTAPSWTYTPNANVNGIETLDVVVSDGTVSLSKTLSITINPVNDSPVLTVSDVSTNEDTPVNIFADASDVDSENLTYSISPATKGVISGAAPNWTYTPNANVNGSETLTIEVTDGEITVSENVTVTIVSVNDVPELVVSDIATNEDAAIALVVQASDADNDPLDYQISEAVNGEISGVAPNWTYTPNENYNGVETLEIQVSDGLETVSQTMIVTIAPENDAPVAQALSYEITLSETVEIQYSGSDVDGDPLTFENFSSPHQGTVVNNIYTPGRRFIGTDTFTYRAFDGLEWSEPVVVSVTVSRVPSQDVIPLPATDWTTTSSAWTKNDTQNLISFSDVSETVPHEITYIGTVDISALNAPELLFKESFYSDYYSQSKILVSRDGINWDTILNRPTNSVAHSRVYQNKLVNLQAYAGETALRVRFSFQPHNNHSTEFWDVRDVVIREKPNGPFADLGDNLAVSSEWTFEGPMVFNTQSNEWEVTDGWNQDTTQGLISFSGGESNAWQNATYEKAFDLTATNRPELIFEDKFVSSYYTIMKVEVSVDGGYVWSEELHRSTNKSHYSGVYQQRVLDLSNYKNESEVRIRFSMMRHANYPNDFWDIREVSVRDRPDAVYAQVGVDLTKDSWKLEGSMSYNETSGIWEVDSGWSQNVSQSLLSFNSGTSNAWQNATLTKAFDLSSANQPELVFKDKFVSSYYTIMKVEVSVDGGFVWEEELLRSTNHTDISLVYQERVLDISKYNGVSELRIRFSMMRHANYPNDYWHIRNVMIRERPTASYAQFDDDNTTDSWKLEGGMNFNETSGEWEVVSGWSQNVSQGLLSFFGGVSNGWQNATLTKAFDLSAAIQPELVFDDKFVSSYYTIMKVEVSVDGGFEWQEELLRSTNHSDISLVYQERVIDISKYNGNSEVRIRFSIMRHANYPSDYWDIRNVVVRERPTAVLVPLESDFSADADWTLEGTMEFNGGWEVTSGWSQNTNQSLISFFQGTSNAWMNATYNKSVDLSSALQPQLVFKERFLSSYYTTQKVEVSVNRGIDWHEVTIRPTNSSATSYVYQEKVLDLTPFLGERDVRIRFSIMRHVNYPNDYWDIRDVSIREKPALVFSQLGLNITTDQTWNLEGSQTYNPTTNQWEVSSGWMQNATEKRISFSDGESNANTNATYGKVFDFSSVQKPELVFLEKYLSSYYTTQRIEVSVDGGVNWTAVLNRPTNSSAYSYVYQKNVVDLSAFAGQSEVGLRFSINRHGNYPNDFWDIRDIEVREHSVSNVALGSILSSLTTWTFEGPEVFNATTEEWELSGGWSQSTSAALLAARDLAVNTTQRATFEQTVDLSNTTAPGLSYHEVYQLGTYSNYKIEVSRDGITWENVFQRSVSTNLNPTINNVDLSPYIGETELTIRFSIYVHSNSPTDFWEFQNVIISD